jgi:hypothetical protein
MHSPSKDITRLIQQNLLGLSGNSLFIGKEPAQPNNCITVYDMGGGVQDAKFAVDEDFVQIRVRDVNYTTGYDKMSAIKLLLEGLNGFADVSVEPVSSEIVGIWVESQIAFLKSDENGRNIFTMTLKIVRKETSLAEAGNRQIV